MLYNLQIKQKENPTETNIFGTRLLLNLGVEILGKTIDKDIFYPFSSIDELITVKRSMRSPPKGNVPITITQEKNKIKVSGRLIKSGSLSHDPNIGALSIICSVLRKLGWEKEIVLTQHGLKQKHIESKNKFILIANKLKLKFERLTLPLVYLKENYWKYDLDGEKLGTIFVHIAVESFTDGYSIFENHAGCEKGYFITSNGDHIPLEKYADKEKYKAGDKNEIIHIPDLILIDPKKSEIINIEGKKYQFRAQGIKELNNYNVIEKQYLNTYYPKFKIKRTVVLFGGKETKIIEVEVGFLLNEKGDIVLGFKAPSLFKEAIKNLLDFWGVVYGKNLKIYQIAVKLYRRKAKNSSSNPPLIS